MLPQSPFGVRVDFDVPATMRDGVVLCANVYRPDDNGAGSYPVLLTRLPYGKDLSLGGGALDPVQAARCGYVVVVQDVRGTFTSGGEWFPLANEGPDGADSVAWAAALPGANGVVGMYGASYFGYTQWAAANQHPAALRAMAPMITWADANDLSNGVTVRGGAIELGLQSHWALQQGLDQMARRYRGNPQALGMAIYGLVRELDGLPKGGYAELPLEHFGPLARMGLDEPLNANINDGTRAQMAERTYTAGAYDLDLPMLHIGGWYDVFLNGTLENFTQMRAHGHTNQRLLIGPWTHGNVQQVQGDLDFGFGASGAFVDLRIDLMSMQLLFFDRWLKGLPNGLDTEPPVKYFLMGANVWKSGDTWPPANATRQPWYLHSQGHANSRDGDGALRVARPVDGVADHYVYDPANPVPTVGGATLMQPSFRAGPRDQQSVEQRADVLVYTSEPLGQPLEVTGLVSAVLYVATDAPDTDFVARLVDVYPDGRAITLTDGITRMRFREGPQTPAAPLEATQTYRVEIDLWSTAVMFLPGHRIRLDVTSSNFPRWERNLNTGANNATTTEMRAARQTILHDEAHPSHVVLPVVEV